MKELVRTVISIGLVDDNQVREFQRWGLIEHVLVLDRVPDTHEDKLARMNLALDVVGYRKETDLSISYEYLRTRKRGAVYVHLGGVDMTAPIDVLYGVTRCGEYILPWNAPGQEDVLTNGKTYLETETHKVFMLDTRPVYFDELQSFVVCKPGFEEERDAKR